MFVFFCLLLVSTPFGNDVDVNDYLNWTGVCRREESNTGLLSGSLGGPGVLVSSFCLRIQRYLLGAEICLGHFGHFWQNLKIIIFVYFLRAKM